MLTRLYGVKSEKVDHDQFLLAFLKDEEEMPDAVGADENAPAAEETKTRSEARQQHRTH